MAKIAFSCKLSRRSVASKRFSCVSPRISALVRRFSSSFECDGVGDSCKRVCIHLPASQPSSTAILFDAITRAVGSEILSFLREGRTNSSRLQTGEILHCGGSICAPAVEHAARRLLSNSALALFNFRIDLPFCFFDARHLLLCAFGAPFRLLSLIDGSCRN